MPRGPHNAMSPRPLASFRRAVVARVASWGLALGLAASATMPAATPGVSEYQLKAAFLTRFPAFVHWPATPPGSGNEPIVIGIIGPNPFGSHLTGLAAQASAKARPLKVVECDKDADASRCHIVFISARDPKRIAEIAKTLENLPVLTVGEGSEFTQFGGIIAMTTVEHRIRIEINTNTASRAGLRIDPQLLQLARVVPPGPAPGSR